MGVVRMVVRAERRRRWRSGLALAVLVGFAGGVVLATLAGARRTDTAYGRLLRSSAAADVQVAASGPGARQNVGGVASYYQALDGLPSVVAVAPQIGISATVPARQDASVLLKAGTDARLGRALERPKIVRGRMFDPARPDEVVADRTVARRLGVHVGSRLSLDVVGGDPIRVRVVGLAVTRDNVIPVNALASDAAFLASPALLRIVRQDAYEFDSAFIRLRAGTSVADFARQARALLPRYPETGGQLFVVDEHRQAARVEDGIRPQAVTLAIFSAVLAVSALLILGQLLARQMFVASSDHGTLRAMGLTRVQRMTISFVPALATVVVDAALAIAVAVVVSPFMPIGPARVAEPHSGFELNWAIVGLGALAMVALFTVLLAPYAWHLASRSSDAAGTTSGGLKRPSRLLTFLTRTGAPTTTVVGARLALEPGRGRTSVPTRSTLFGAVICVIAVAGAVTFGTNLVRLVETPARYGQTWQASVDLGFDQVSRHDTAALLEHQPGVTGWTLGNHDDATIDGRATPAIVLSAGHGPAMFPTVLEGRAPRTENETVLGTTTLERLHRSVGDTVQVSLQGDKSARRLRVVGRAVFPFFGQGEVTPTGLGDGAALFVPKSAADGFNFVLVGVAPSAQQHDDVVHLLRAVTASQVCGGGRCSTVTEQRPADVRNFASVERTPLVLAAVLSVLGFAAAAHLLVTSIRRRRRDLAILKMLGFERRQVSAAVAWQATIVAALALAIGLPLGTLAGLAAWRWFATRLGVSPDSAVPLLASLVAVPVVLVIANAVAAVPARAAARVRPSVILHTE